MIYLLYILIAQVILSLFLAIIYTLVTYILLHRQARKINLSKVLIRYTIMLTILNLSQYLLIVAPLVYLFGEFYRIVSLLILSYFIGKYIKDTDGKGIGYMMALFVTVVAYLIAFGISYLFGFDAIQNFTR